MSGLFGAKGPSPLAMLRGELREGRKYKEMPGFSGTMKQDPGTGEWRKARGPSSSALLKKWGGAAWRVKSPLGKEYTKVRYVTGGG